MQRNSVRPSQQNCHPDRSIAQWRDLLFLPAHSQLQLEPPLFPCHPDRSEAKWRDLQCALRLSQILPSKSPGGTNPQSNPYPNPILQCRVTASFVQQNQPHRIDQPANLDSSDFQSSLRDLRRVFPQPVKPWLGNTIYGTAEAVPFQNRVLTQTLKAPAALPNQLFQSTGDKRIYVLEHLGLV